MYKRMFTGSAAGNSDDVVSLSTGNSECATSPSSAGSVEPRVNTTGFLNLPVTVASLPSERVFQTSSAPCSPITPFFSSIDQAAFGADSILLNTTTLPLCEVSHVSDTDPYMSYGSPQSIQTGFLQLSSGNEFPNSGASVEGSTSYQEERRKDFLIQQLREKNKFLEEEFVQYKIFFYRVSNTENFR